VSQVGIERAVEVDVISVAVRTAGEYSLVVVKARVERIRGG